MPKLVTQAQMGRWRELLSEGKDYKEIGRITGWQDRTVRKHLESDIRSSGATQIRRELFKERLGQHWDMLLENVLASLDSLKPLPPQESVLSWISSSGSAREVFMGAVVARTDDWDLSVEVQARSLVEWPLLRQHILRDPLWEAVQEWEVAFKADLLGRRKYYMAVQEHLRHEAGGLPVAERTAGERALTPRAIYAVFIEGCVRSLGLSSRTIDERSVMENTAGELKVLGVNNAAHGQGLREPLLKAASSGVDLWATFPGSKRWSTQYQALERATRELNRTITHLRLLRYLPGVCSVCSRFDV